MQIFVKMLDGKTISLEVTEDEKVEDVKAKIEAREGIERDNQRLLYIGKPLQDGHALSEYDIQKEATVFLFARLPGGIANLNKQSHL